MNIEKQIYKLLLDNAGGVQARIKGITKPTLIKMRNGHGQTTFSKLFKTLFENGIQTATLCSEHTEMHINAVTNEVSVTTKRKVTNNN